MNNGIFNAPSGAIKLTQANPYSGAFIYNNGTFNANNGLVELAGSWIQRIILNKDIVFNNLFINNAASTTVYIDNNTHTCTVNNNLTLAK